MTAKTTRTPKCTICNHPQQAKFRPFCSPRCADVDLHRWLTGGYRIPTDETASPEEMMEAMPTASDQA